MLKDLHAWQAMTASSHASRSFFSTASVQAVLRGKADTAGEQVSSSAPPAVQQAQQQWIGTTDLATLELLGCFATIYGHGQYCKVLLKKHVMWQS